MDDWRVRAKYGEKVMAYSLLRRKISDALVPPKPNEFDSTVLIGRCRALWGTRSMAVSTDGLSRLMVGGAI